jgi:hypothetical protein
MINVKTVFVLGAGASNPFGYPVGSGLYQAVLDNFQSGGPGNTHLLNTTRFMQKDVDGFLLALSRSGQTSVDAFLERRFEDFLEIGKAAMAIELMLRENEPLLWQQPNWMFNLFGRMSSETLEEFDENEVAFVTFNYDRSLEHFLCTSLANYFGKPVEACAKVLLNIPIVHLHGRLGYLPWQQRESRAYGDTSITAQSVNMSVKEMRVVHEDITDRDKDFAEAKELLHAAERVYLMGFGFGARNVERIELTSLKPSVFSGTAYGLTASETAYCRKQCGDTVNLYNSSPCLEFLRNQFENN